MTDLPLRRSDHGYCVSLYLKTPDGRRLLGDRRTNNHMRPA
jgi:hypothetical protein